MELLNKKEDTGSSTLEATPISIGISKEDTSKVEVKDNRNSFTTRFQDAKWCISGLPVTIIGLGGVGSYLSMFLAKQETKMFIYDKDDIMAVNIGSQNFTKENLGSGKTETIHSNCLNNGANEVVAFEKFFEKDDILTPYVFCCVDSFTDRKMIFEAFLEKYKRFKENFEDYKDEHLSMFKTLGFIFIDVRMMAEVLWVYSVDPTKEEQIEAYKKTIYSEEYFPDPVCTFKGTGHCGCMCACYAVSVFNNFIYNQIVGEEIREVPYCINEKLEIFLNKVTL